MYQNTVATIEQRSKSPTSRGIVYNCRQNLVASVVVQSAATPQKMLPIGNKIWSRRSSCDSHHRAEMSTMVDKTCLVSESFGSSSVASLRKPPTWFHRVRACAGEDDFTSSDRRPIRPQRPPEHPPLLGHTRLPPNPHRIGNCQAKGRICLSDSSVAMHGGNSRSIRQVIPRHRERSWWVLQSRTTPLLLADR